MKYETIKETINLLRELKHTVINLNENFYLYIEDQKLIDETENVIVKLEEVIDNNFQNEKSIDDQVTKFKEKLSDDFTYSSLQKQLSQINEQHKSGYLHKDYAKEARKNIELLMFKRKNQIMKNLNINPELLEGK